MKSKITELFNKVQEVEFFYNALASDNPLIQLKVVDNGREGIREITDLIFINDLRNKFAQELNRIKDELMHEINTDLY